ncbi:glycoside hydrolase family 32 [Lecanosticta acicola]|uniref:Glycoside hydrolase family 32 n=1 Tax=Lecanosticta acicola TaxID=111012 RepID=A0AAI9E821_9PEZI|nr:glycoside hydrolase family 32 [Lecanosticta acicola]
MKSLLVVLAGSSLASAEGWAWGGNRPSRLWGRQETASHADEQSCAVLTADSISSMGNNSLYTRWRPQSHFIAPAGWMNDPCGAMYDPVRDEYHMSYQWHPEHFNWGNISWGSATSKDLITWTDHGSWQGTDALILGPSGNGSYNGLGIFSGTAQPVNLHGEQDGTLLIFYTSVSKLPTSWSIPYQPYTETQSLATSKDGGKTWQEYAGNPVIDTTTETAPMFWNVTGFRDPFFEPLPELDALLGVSEPHYYAVFGSGIKGVGPRMPIWTAPASDLTKWTFLGALWEPQANTSVGPVLSTGSYGDNFEVSGFFPLRDSKGNQHWFVNMGSEGGNVSFHQSPSWALWNGGSVSARENGSVEFVPTYGGAGDWGSGYALSSFNDTKHNRRVQYAWIKEDYIGNGGLFSVPQQGFQGALSLPRELFVHEVRNVESTAELLDSKTANLQNGTAYTLGVRPLPDVVEGLRQGTKYTCHGGKKHNSTTLLSRRGSSHMQIKTSFSPSKTTAAGLRILASPDGSEFTTILYQPTNHTLLVDRTHSSRIVEFNNATITGYFLPYIIAGEEEEDITMDVFIDGSVVEIYVNDRFALTARIYPANSCSTGYGVYVEEGGEGVEFKGIETWVGMKNVWPERPVNASSRLVWDSAEETNGYTWWTGN